MPIRILPDHVVRRIRAGETVGRPASAAKELVENALDAGALRIQVDVEDAGRSLLMVEDDGCGMIPEDLVLCGLPHATSKISDERGLLCVSTYGFRGEAMASLATVAELTVSSRVRGANTGWRVKFGVPGLVEAEPCSRPAGTTLVEVRDLFAAHPARLAFLKAPKTELAAIRSVIENAALSRPQTAFILNSGGRQILSYPPADPASRIAAVAAGGLAANSLQVDHSAGTMHLRGLAGLPAWRGHAGGGQRFLVNGRPVQDRTLAQALRAAYSDLSGASAPSAILMLELPPGEVDVNCHPAKAEVRFRDAAAVHAFVRTAVRTALSGGAAPAVSAMAYAVRQAASLAMVPVDLDENTDRRLLPLGKAVGLVLDGYTVAETLQGLVLIDTHAMAERAAYERLLSGALDGGAEARRLGSPVMLDVGAEAAAAVEEEAGALLQLGFDLHAIDGTALCVAAVPSFLPDRLVEDAVRSIAADLAGHSPSGAARDVLADICARMACHAAFRFGDDATPEQLDAMLREFERTPHISTCMHGRPTVMALPLADLQRGFGRR